MPRRADLESERVEVLHAGRAIKANLLRLDLGEGPIVVKDFGQKAWWVRFAGRVQIKRELRAYRRLAGVEGVPALLGRVDPYALAIEYVEGHPIGMDLDRGADGPARLRALSEVVSRLHRRGVLHMDLRATENALVRDDGKVVVVDFAGAVCLRPGGLLHRLLFDKLAMTDRSALLKWKGLLGAGPLSDEENAFLERHRRMKKWWPFNKKRQAAQ